MTSNPDDAFTAIAGTFRPLPEKGWPELRSPANGGRGTKQTIARLNDADQMAGLDLDGDSPSQGQESP